MWQRLLSTLFGRPEPEPESPRAAFKAWQRQQGVEKALILAKVLSRNDPEVIGIVNLAIEDPEAYLQARGGSARRGESLADVNPFFAALEALERNHYSAEIDWKSDADELKAALHTLLEARGVHGFDWSFIDELMAAEDWEALQNENLLPLVGGDIAKRGLVLASIDTGGDSYAFAVVAPAEFAEIDGIQTGDFSIGRWG